MVTNNKKGVPWSIIIILLIFCFYIGIPVMLHKLHVDKQNMLINAKRTTTVGWVIFGIGVIYLLSGFTGSLTTEDGTSALGIIIMMVVLCCGGGYAIVRNAKKYKSLGLMYEHYLPVISNSATGSLDEIAEAIGETYDVTVENVQKLIDAEVFENSYIDKTRRCLISPVVSSRYKTSNTAANRSFEKVTVPKVKAVKCPNCGGVNNITEGAENICDFCGSPLELQK